MMQTILSQLRFI